MFRLHLSFQTIIYLKLEIEISNLKCILTGLDCKTVGFFLKISKEIGKA